MKTKIVETNKLVSFKNREYYFDDIEGEDENLYELTYYSIHPRSFA